MDEDIVNRLVCPACKRTLQVHGLRHRAHSVISGRLDCRRCLQAYPIIAGIPSLLSQPHPYPVYFLPPEDLLPTPPASRVERVKNNGIQLAVKYYGRSAFLDAIRKRRPANRFDICHLRDARALQKAYRFSRAPFVTRILERMITKRCRTDERCLGIVNILRAAKPHRLLDIASGPGGLLTKAMPRLRSTRAVGLGISLENCRMVTGLAQHLRFGHRLQMIHGDARAAPFPDGTFDCVSGWTAAYHISQYERAIQECARVLVRGGHFVGTLHTTYPSHAQGALTRAEEEEFIRWAHLPLDIPSVCSILQSAGFTVSHKMEIGNSHLLVAEKA
jgi:uncharacterized protein YbaR (Trm112 family)/SAM-dependent methyltransferase